MRLSELSLLTLLSMYQDTSEILVIREDDTIMQVLADQVRQEIVNRYGDDVTSKMLADTYRWRK